MVKNSTKEVIPFLCTEGKIGSLGSIIFEVSVPTPYPGRSWSPTRLEVDRTQIEDSGRVEIRCEYKTLLRVTGKEEEGFHWMGESVLCQFRISFLTEHQEFPEGSGLSNVYTCVYEGSDPQSFLLMSVLSKYLDQNFFFFFN